MSEPIHDDLDRAYEAGREVGRIEAWSGEWSYRRLMDETRERAIKDCIAAVDSVPCRGGLMHMRDCTVFVSDIRDSLLALLDTQ